MSEGLSDWWDSVELWLAQLWFPLQFVLVMAVVVPLCLVAAWLIDRIVGSVSTRWRLWRGGSERSRRSS